MDENQERRIAQGLREGRPEAWRELYDALAPRVWRTVARLLGSSSADVADLVQETFLAAARSARGFDADRGSLWQWLWGITRNHLALHWRRQQQAARAMSRNGKVQAEMQESVDQLAPLIAEERASLVRVILADLPDEYGTLLTDHYLDEVPVAQLALEWRCTEVALRSRLARARAAFRSAMFARGVSDSLPNERQST